MKFIITAGGHGTKIWPYSRKSKPKQFQQIIGKESLFTYNIDLLLKQYKPEDIYISTKKAYLELAREQAPLIPMENYILEPNVPKDRGPGEGLAFLVLSIKHPDEPFIIIQSDNIRIPEEKYLHMLGEMDKLVLRDKKYITGGIKPEYPVLGVDYLKLSKKIETGSELNIHAIERFVERKKDYEETKEIIKSHVVVHCNHSCWLPDLMLEAYKKYRPDWHESLMQIKEVILTSNDEEKIEEIYSQMEKGSTEEVTRNIFSEGYAVTLPYKWIDIGTWDSLFEYAGSENGSYVDGNIVSIDSKGILVKSKNKEKLIAVVGIENMVIVDTDDILFIAPRDKSDQVKQIHTELQNKNMEYFL